MRERLVHKPGNPPQRTRYDYDAVGQLTLARNADARVQLLYTPAGQIASEILLTRHGQRSKLDHCYDELGNRVETRLPDGRVVNTLTYGAGHVHQINLDGTPISDFERDNLHREIQRSQGALTSRYRLDALGRLLESTAQPNPSNPAPANTTHGQHIARRYHYDAIGRLTQALTNHAQERFAFDRAHNLIDPESTSPKRSTTAPLSDDAWADYVRAHIHDPDFNPLQASEHLETAPEHWDKIPDNRLKTWQDHRYQYDAWGNCVEKRSGPREIQHYTWDGEHQLIAAKIENRQQQDGQSETWHYAYDPFGRRIAKWQQGKPRTTTHYTWDGNRLLAESNQLPAHTPAEAQTRHTLYLYEPDSFVPLAQVDSTWEPDEHEALRTHLYTDPEQNQQLQAAQNDPFIWNWHVKPLHQRLREQMGLPAIPPRNPPLTTRTLYYHTDHLGTPRELTDAYGQIVWAATYKAWGRVQNIDYPPILRTVQRGNTLAEEWVTPYPHERPVQNLRFQGQYCDEETGLHYNRFRYYDPECGRFVSQDPIGLFGGDNFYQYASNPVEWIDPLGLAPCCKAKNPAALHAAIKEKHGYAMQPQEMRNVQNAVDRIKRGQTNQKYKQDGTTYRNSRAIDQNSTILNTNGNYKEYVIPTPNLKGSGARRIVHDTNSGRMYYTHDHYRTFIEINPMGWK